MGRLMNAEAGIDEPSPVNKIDLDGFYNKLGPTLLSREAVAQLLNTAAPDVLEVLLEEHQERVKEKPVNRNPEGLYQTPVQGTTVPNKASDVPSDERLDYTPTGPEGIITEVDPFSPPVDEQATEKKARNVPLPLKPLKYIGDWGICIGKYIFADELPTAPKLIPDWVKKGSKRLSDRIGGTWEIKKLKEWSQGAKEYRKDWSEYRTFKRYRHPEVSMPIPHFISKNDAVISRLREHKYLMQDWDDYITDKLRGFPAERPPYMPESAKNDLKNFFTIPKSAYVKGASATALAALLIAVSPFSSEKTMEKIGQYLKQNFNQAGQYIGELAGDFKPMMAETGTVLGSLGSEMAENAKLIAQGIPSIDDLELIVNEGVVQDFVIKGNPSYASPKETHKETGAIVKEPYKDPAPDSSAPKEDLVVQAKISPDKTDKSIFYGERPLRQNCSPSTELYELLKSANISLQEGRSYSDYLWGWKDETGSYAGVVANAMDRLGIVDQRKVHVGKKISLYASDLPQGRENKPVEYAVTDYDQFIKAGDTIAEINIAYLNEKGIDPEPWLVKSLNTYVLDKMGLKTGKQLQPGMKYSMDAEEYKNIIEHEIKAHTGLEVILNEDAPVSSDVAVKSYIPLLLLPLAAARRRRRKGTSADTPDHDDEDILQYFGERLHQAVMIGGSDSTVEEKVQDVMHVQATSIDRIGRLYASGESASAIANDYGDPAWDSDGIRDIGMAYLQAHGMTRKGRFDGKAVEDAEKKAAATKEVLGAKEGRELFMQHTNQQISMSHYRTLAKRGQEMAYQRAA
ncbi:MAG: hypothetical protein ABIH34_08245 [Nanoarchaeota archaeon]